MGKELAVKPPTDIEVQAEVLAQAQEVVASDVLIPRLLLGQGTSPMVRERKAQIGDMSRSTTGEKLGDPEHPLEIVPLKMVNSWLTFEDMGTGQPVFRGMQERNASNESLPWEFVGENGEDMIRKKAITLYALIPSDVAKYEAELKKCTDSGEMFDLSRTVMPVVITFMGTAYKYGGKKCASFFNNVRVNANRVKGLAPFKYTLTLSCREEKSGTNAWYIYDLSPPKGLMDQRVREEAAKWAVVLSSKALRVDDASETMETGGGEAAMTEEV